MNKKMNIIGLIGSALLIVCVFLPFATAELWGYSETATLMDGSDGPLFIAVAVFGIIFSIINKPILVTIAGVVACFFSILEIQSFKDNDLAAFGGELSKGIGFWVMLAGSIILLVAGIIDLLNKKKA